MFYIKLDHDMNLVVTSREPIYRGDHLNQKIIYLIPFQVGDINMAAATVYLSYIRADGTADIVLLKLMEDDYNESYHQYTFPVTCTLSRYAGEVCSWLQIYSGPAKHPIIAKSGECILHITGSKNMDEYISDRNFILIVKERSGWGYTGTGWVSLAYITKTENEEDDDMDVNRFSELWNEMRKGLQDNDCGSYSEQARQWATSSGLVVGGDPINSEPNYMWQDLMTREQLVTVLYRFAQMMGKA